MEVYTKSEELAKVRDAIEAKGLTVVRGELIQKPINIVEIAELDKVKRILSFLDKLDEHEDVQNVFVNLNIPDAVLEQVDAE